MLYSEFKNKKLSMLGMGCMRLPTNENGKIDITKTREMVAFAIENGVNYFDTAYPYHNGESELVIGEILSHYPRESYYLADKFPGHQISSSYDPATVFEDQLKKCKVDYFDFYLLHNVYENSINTYRDSRWGIIDYFREQKKNGRIKHLGFSTHGSIEIMKEFLDEFASDMEFCQIQLNYLDWTLQSAREKCELLEGYNIPVWVMEPVRGGKLANLNEADTARLKALRPEESVAAFAFRFLQSVPNVKMILSGMSNFSQLCDNIKTFSNEKPLNSEEKNILFEIAEGLKNSIPCTKCGYCVSGCPQGIDIPRMLEFYNEMRIAPTTNITMRIDALPVSEQPASCIGCENCVNICPQNIKIPEHLADLVAISKKLPSWTEISKQREEAAKRLRGE
ncbi:MAG: aldo/keto reductase [Clostridia bacterium]|nr:aldo/keto reductase [Clostridia bacterium]